MSKKGFTISDTYKYLNDQKEKEIKIISSLIFTERMALVQKIVDAVFNEKGYFPYLFEYASWANILSAYSSFDIDISIDDFCSVIHNTDICDVIERNVVGNQIREILNYSKEIIDFKKNQHYTEFDYLCRSVREIVSKYDKQLSKLLGSKLEGLIDALSNMDLSEKAIIDALVDRIADYPESDEHKILSFPKMEEDG